MRRLVRQTGANATVLRVEWPLGRFGHNQNLSALYHDAHASVITGGGGRPVSVDTGRTFNVSFGRALARKRSFCFRQPLRSLDLLGTAWPAKFLLTRSRLPYGSVLAAGRFRRF